MLLDFYMHFDLVLVHELAQIDKVLMPDDLVRTVTKAEEDNCFAVFETWVHNLQFHKLTSELDWKRTAQDL